MKDSLALVAGTTGAAVVQVGELIGDVSPVVANDTFISSAITLVTGLVSMLLSRWLNNIFKKKDIK